MKNNIDIEKVLGIGLKLLLICFISGFILSLINILTEPVIKARQGAEEAAALEEIFPGGVPQKPRVDVNEGVVVSRYNILKEGSPAGYILELAGNGYNGNMKILAGYKPDGEVVNVKLMDNEETPGLGKLAEESSYMKKFIGKGGVNSSYPIPLTRDMLASQQGSSGDTKEVLTGMKWVAAVLIGRSSGGGGDSVTGATITFSGISRAVKEGSDYLIKFSGGSK